MVYLTILDNWSTLALLATLDKLAKLVVLEILEQLAYLVRLTFLVFYLQKIIKGDLFYGIKEGNLRCCVTCCRH